MDTNGHFNINFPFPLGSVIENIQSTDHNGWYLCDGRSLDILSVAARNNATNLGLTTLPDLRDVVTKMKGNPLSGGGSDNVNIGQGNLPNISLDGNTASTTVSYTDTQRDQFTRNGTRSNVANRGSKNVTRTLTIPSLNVTVPLGGSDEPLNIENKYISLNKFIYLGE